MTKTEWLSLSQAAAILGVHPGTVRNWSDQGVLPVHRTQGGHRRFRREDIELWLQSQRANAPSEGDRMMQTALRNTRLKISEGRLGRESWYNKLDDEARNHYRLSGRLMLQGMISSLSANAKAAQDEAQALGYDYASRARRYGLSVVEATHAFLFFRNVLIESMLVMYEEASIRSPHAWGDLFRKVNAFTDRMMTSLLDTYETVDRNQRQPS